MNLKKKFELLQLYINYRVDNWGSQLIDFDSWMKERELGSVVVEKRNKILEAFNHLLVVYEKKTNKSYTTEHYSTTIQLFPTEADKLRIILPQFHFTHLYLNWWIVGFNKKIKPNEI